MDLVCVAEMDEETIVLNTWKTLEKFYEEEFPNFAI